MGFTNPKSLKLMNKILSNTHLCIVSLAHLLVYEGWTCSYRLCGRSRLRPSSGVSIVFALLSRGCHARLRTFTYIIALALPHSFGLYSWPKRVTEAIKEILSNFRGTRRYVKLVSRSLLPEWDVRGNPRNSSMHCRRKRGRRRWRRFGTQRRCDSRGTRTTARHSSDEEKLDQVCRMHSQKVICICHLHLYTLNYFLGKDTLIT